MRTPVAACVPAWRCGDRRSRNRAVLACSGACESDGDVRPRRMRSQVPEGALRVPDQADAGELGGAERGAPGQGRAMQPRQSSHRGERRQATGVSEACHRQRQRTGNVRRRPHVPAQRLWRPVAAQYLQLTIVVTGVACVWYSAVREGHGLVGPSSEEGSDSARFRHVTALGRRDSGQRRCHTPHGHAHGSLTAHARRHSRLANTRTDQSHSRDGGSQQNRPRSHARHKASRGHLALAGPLVGGASPRLLEEALAGLEHARDVGQVGVDGREGRHDLAVVRLDDARERGHGAGHLGRDRVG
eukprot:scaffold130752_cov54-Phaeocystis_antarctica.AAC.1